MWAGGKNKMLKYHAPFLPATIETYSEPFFGGGAMFLHVQKEFAPKRCFIGDANASIMAIYQAIQNDVVVFCDIVSALEKRYLPLEKVDRKRFYYDLRHEHAYCYENWEPTYEAATLYFLMKTGFNGVWQINQNTNGRYGTPSGLLNQKDKVYCRETVLAWCKLLQNTELFVGSYEGCPQGSVNYLDPPYRSSTTAYGSDWDDCQLDGMLGVYREADGKVLVCNRDDGSGYFDVWGRYYQMYTFPVSYTVGRNGKTGATEVLLVR